MDLELIEECDFFIFSFEDQFAFSFSIVKLNNN